MALSRFCAAIAICLLWGTAARPSYAGDEARCPNVDGAAPALGAIEPRVRLAFVRETMRVQARRARQWSYAWAATGLGLAAGSYTQAALAKTNDDRLDPLVGGTTSLFIPAAILVQPLEVIAQQATLETKLAHVDAGLPFADICGALAESERLFAASAKNEAFSAGIFTHIFVIVGNGAVALFLGLGYDHWRGALVNGGGGLLISELQILTQPTGAVTALAEYRRGLVERPPLSASRTRLSWSPLLGKDMTGVAVNGSF